MRIHKLTSTDAFVAFDLDDAPSVGVTRLARKVLTDGAELLVNPTNGSSYWLTQVQTQQVASNRLRALETDRWLLQAAPTGFSAIYSPDGEVLVSIPNFAHWYPRAKVVSGRFDYDQRGPLDHGHVRLDAALRPLHPARRARCEPGAAPPRRRPARCG